MQPLKPAEMQEANLTSMVLFMKRIDIAGLGHCDFMNRPGSHGPACWQGVGWDLASALAVRASGGLGLCRSMFPTGANILYSNEKA